MKVLLDTNIVISREANFVRNSDIGQLFFWIDKLHYTKCIHPATEAELKKHKDPKRVRLMGVKAESYTTLKTQAPVHPSMNLVTINDVTPNDINDSIILNELVSDRVDYLITEDRGIHAKAVQLGVDQRVYNIGSFIEKLIGENPTLINYKVLAISTQHFGNILITDQFFDSFRMDYPGFDAWFNKKADEEAYVCEYNGKMAAFLYVKVESEKEIYNNILPSFSLKKRLKIGTFKVTLTGLKIGERFLKIIFDNALLQKVDEVYVTIYNNDSNKQRLIDLLEEYGFMFWGNKDNNGNKDELVYVRDMHNRADASAPKTTFPFIQNHRNVYFGCLKPEYHTELFPDSILNNETRSRYTDNKPHRNAIEKVYVSRAYDRTLQSGDVITFYRNGGYYAGVLSTIAIVNEVYNNIPTEDEFISLCKGRTIYSEQELRSEWNKSSHTKPFVVKLLYAHSLPKRLNLKQLIELGVIADERSIPRGFGKIGWDNFIKIIKASGLDENTIIH